MPIAWAKKNKANQAKGARLILSQRQIKDAYFAELHESASTKESDSGVSADYIVAPSTGWYRAEKETGKTKAELIKINNLASDKLSPNQVLKTSVEKSSASSEASTHVVKSKETLYGIGRQHDVSVAELKKLNGLKNNDISVGQELKLSAGDEEIKFEKIKRAQIGQEVYLVIETENLSDQEIEVEVRQGKAEVIAAENAAISIEYDGQTKTTVKVKVGEFAQNSSDKDNEELKKLAVAKVRLGGEDKDKQDQWRKKIKDKKLALTHFYLAVDAHTANGLDESVIDYKGYAGTDDDSSVENHFLNEKNAWLELALEDHICEYCEKEITLDQIKKSFGGTVSAKGITNIKAVLPYLNKYRKDFGLDTCLKKAHFFAQVIHESARFKSFEEYESWNYWNSKTNSVKLFPGVYSSRAVVFDSTMAASLEDHLTSIFSFKDKNDKTITRSNAQIKKVLLDEKVKVVDKKLYAKYDRGTELVHTVKEKKKDAKGKEIETVKYKIYLVNHAAFGVPLLSRMYAPYPGDRRGLGNGDELSRDGWKYKGRGLKQLTGIGNYRSFSHYRNRADVNFPDDNTGDIDFSANTDTTVPQDVKKGNYTKIAKPMYAVQSALYFWMAGTRYNSKYAVQLAEDDDIEGVSKAVNRHDKKGLPSRKSFYNSARKKDAFHITRHYKELYDNGSAAQKKEAKAYFTKWKDSDVEAKKHLAEINKK